MPKTSPSQKKKASTSTVQQAVRGKSPRQHNAMLEVLRQFRIVMQSIKRHYQWVSRDAGVSGSQLWAMVQIHTKPGMRVSDLARELGIHQSTASNLLDVLQAQKLIERKRVGRDQRTVQLFLTDAGKRSLSRAPKPLRGVLQQALLDLPEARLARLHADLAVLIGKMTVRETAAKAMLLSEMIGRTEARSGANRRVRSPPTPS